jgi:hypothetical protein
MVIVNYFLHVFQFQKILFKKTIDTTSSLSSNNFTRLASLACVKKIVCAQNIITFLAGTQVANVRVCLLDCWCWQVSEDYM